MLTEKNQTWVKNAYIDERPTSEGAYRKVLAYGDAAMCVENHFEKGAVGALHSHPHTQVTYIAEGSFEFTIGDEKRVVHKGDAMIKRDGVTHGCVCLEKGVIVDFFTPMREDFVS